MQKALKDKLIPIEFGEERCKSLHFYGYGRRAFFLVHYVVDGKGTFEVDGKVYSLKKGDSFIIYPYKKVKYVADKLEPWHYVWANFSGEVAEEIIGETLFVSSPVLREANEDMYSLFLNLIKSDKKKDVDLVLSHLLVLLATYKSIYPAKKDKKEGAVSSACKYIEANLHRSTLTVESVADHLGVDRSDLFRRFRRDMGVSVKGYIVEKRMNLAYSLLKKGSSIKETAYSVGYSDPLYFSKAFFAFFGIKAREIKSKV